MKGAPDYERVWAYWKHNDKAGELRLKNIMLYIITMLFLIYL